ncbi:MAG: helix-turn-helix domain-containing protein [Polymorphobacter sp.]
MPVIDSEHLVFDRLAGGEPPSPLPGQVRHHEARVIRDAIANSRSRRAAAQRLGISERTLRYKLAAMNVGLSDAGNRDLQTRSRVQ